MPERLISPEDFETLAEEILACGHTLRFTARGGSMRPFVLPGEVVEIVPLEGRSLRRGEIVLCRLAGGPLVLHRVVRVTPGGLLLQGDALSRPDGLVQPGQILGRAAAVVRGGQRAALNTRWLAFLVNLWMFLSPVRPFLLRMGRTAGGSAKLRSL